MPADTPNNQSEVTRGSTSETASLFLELGALFDKAFHYDPVLQSLPEYDTGEMLGYRVSHLPVVDECGKWRLRAICVGKDNIYSGQQNPVVPEGLYTGLYYGEGRGRENLWMCDTPPEVASMLPAIRHFERSDCRRVLIGGLGLGVLAQAALRHEHVERVDVIEKDPDVIGLVAPHYPDERLTVHEGDALYFLPDAPAKWDYGYYDIWREVVPSNLVDFERIRELTANRVEAVEFWHEAHARKMADSAEPGIDF